MLGRARKSFELLVHGLKVKNDDEEWLNFATGSVVSSTLASVRPRLSPDEVSRHGPLRYDGAIASSM